MKLLLAVDTSGRNGSLALARIRPGAAEIAVLEVVSLSGGAFSSELVPQLAALLEKHGHSKSELAAFAVVNGPGSFTGLRVGLAAIKALADALQQPIVPVSLLEAVACSGGTTRGRVLAALDAGRGDAYVGDYELEPQARAHSERLLSGNEFLTEAALATASGRGVITPDARLADVARAAGVVVEKIDYPNAGVIARLGALHLQLGQTVRPEELEANYMRHSDAEIFSKPAP
jgi:tRNA threonylcarbamoyladenosine biosynthesis protein TsaB